MSEISDIMRRVITLFEVRGANQVNAQLGQMRSGMAGYRSEITRTTRPQSLLNDQVRALGTTLRYAFAGSAIFGVVSMVRNLGEFQSKLGDISAIATGGNGLPIVGRQLDDLGDRLLRVSNDTAQPIDDLEQGVLSLYSTIGNVPPNKAADIMETMAKVATTSQAGIEDTTQALLGMMNAFGRGTGAIKEFGDEFQTVIKLSAGMPGSVYASKLGVLSASASLARFTPEQMSGLAIGATRFGGSANTNMTYLAQLMTYLVNPTTKKEKDAFASIGLSQKDLQTKPGMEILKTVLRQINARGGVGISKSLANASDDQLSILDQMNGGAGATNEQAGISGGGADLLNKLFGRIQSRRMAAVLSKLYSENQVAGTKNLTLDQYIQQVTHSAGAADKAMDRAMDRKRIVQAGNAWHNLGIEIANAFGPLLNPAAHGITGLSDAVGSANPWVRFGTTLGFGGGLAGAYMKFGRAGVGRVARGVPVAGAVMDTLGGGNQLGASPLHPMYVYNVSSLFGGGRTPSNWPGAMIPNRDMRTAEGELGTASKMGKFSRFRGAAGRAGGYAILAAVGTDAAVQEYQSHMAELHAAQNDPHALLDYGMKKRAGIHIPWVGTIGGGYTYQHMNPKEREIYDRYKKGLISGDAAERALRSVASKSDFELAGIGKLYGTAKVAIDITQKDATGKTTHKKRAHVNVDLFPDFTQSAPQRKGKNTTPRSGK